MNFTTNSNGTCDGFCLIKTVDKKINVKGVMYLDLVLCDSTGEIASKLWDYKPESHGDYVSGDLVKIRGVVSQYNGNDQLKIERIRKVIDIDGVKISDFVPSAEYEGEYMLEKLYSVINSIKDADIKRLSFAIIKDNEEKLLYFPAAFKLHHAMRGGLLYHTLSIIEIAKNVCKIYPAIDYDLLMAGAALHDICKIQEFDVNSAGLVSSYSTEGELIGHLVMGAVQISQKAKELGMTGDAPMLLEHMVISHHGVPEFGAAVRPMFLEAEILSQLDTLDATIYEIIAATSQVEVGAFTPRQWALDNRKLYNHGRKDNVIKANLD
ncbi:MAG: HD domain-containing protein [Clostridia bacterium]